MTDQLITHFYNKKVEPISGFKDRFLDYLLGRVEDEAENTYRQDGVFDTLVPVIPGGANNTIDIAQAAGFRAINGKGRTIELAAADSRLNDVKMPPSAGTVFHVGLEQNHVESGIEINPRTGQPEYTNYKELIGRTGTPTLITDNGDGTITIRVNSITEAGYDYSGLSVRVWLKARDQGGIGPLGTTEGVAIETRPIVYTGGNNVITTTTRLGQNPAGVSTTVGNYVIQLIGPTIRRSAAEDLRSTAGVFFIAAVTSVASGNPIVTIDTTDQRILRSVGEIDDQLKALAREGFFPGVISTGMQTVGAGGLSVNVGSGSAWVDGTRFTKATSTVVSGLTDNTTNYVYMDAGGTFQKTTSLATAFALGVLVVARVVTAGGVVTSVSDARRIFRQANGKWSATVGLRGEFGDINHAMEWIKEAQAAGLLDRPPVELILLGQQTYAGTQTIDAPRVTLRGLSDSVINWTFNGPCIDIEADDVKLIGIHGYFNMAGAQASSRFARVASADTAHRLEIRDCNVYSPNANLDTAIELAGTGDEARAVNNRIRDAINGVLSQTGFDGAIIRDNHLTTVATGGIGIEVTGGSATVVRDNHIIGTFASGITGGAAADRQAIQNNWIEDVTSYGINSSGDDAVISGNIVENPATPTAGIYSNGKDAQIIGNKVHDHDGGWGIWASGRNPQVVGNCVRTSSTAITGFILIDDATAGAPGFVCSGNHVGGEGTLPTDIPGAVGIDAEAANKGAINGNYVANCGDSTTGGAGIKAGDQQAVVGNCVQNCYGRGIQLYGDESTCVGNVVDDINGIAGIEVSGDKNTVTGNTVSNVSATYSIRILSTANDTICQVNNVNGAVSDIGTNTMLGANVTDNNNTI